VSARGSSLGVEGNTLFPVLFLVILVCCLRIFISVPVLLLLSSVVIGISSLFLLFLSFSLSFFSFCCRCSASFVIILVYFLFVSVCGLNNICFSYGLLVFSYCGVSRTKPGTAVGHTVAGRLARLAGTIFLIFIRIYN